MFCALDCLAEHVDIRPFFGRADVGMVCFQAHTPHKIIGADFSQNSFAGVHGSVSHLGVLGKPGVSAAENFIVVGVFPRGLIKVSDTAADTILDEGITIGHDIAQAGFVVEESRFGSHHELFGKRMTDVSYG